jgi:negative regulator of genetic competence, sporulation and motility
LDAHSTEDFVNPHADLTPKDSEQWTPKKIVEEFERNGFLQMMDELNKAMEFVPVQ